MASPGAYFQSDQDGFVEEPAVGAQQSDPLVAKMVQGRFEKFQDVVGGVRIARP